MALTRRRFLWHYPAPVAQDAEYVCAQVRRVLTHFATEWPQWYADPHVTGQAFGLVEFGITVFSRDQWWVAKRVRRLLTALRNDTEMFMGAVFEASEKLPPHEHRGKTYLEAVRDGSKV